MDKTNYLLDKVSQIESELQLQAQINQDTQEKIDTNDKNITSLQDKTSTLDTKVATLQDDISTCSTSIDKKVDKVDGKDLSTNDYDNEEKNNVANNTLSRHTHLNKTVLDDTTASFTTEEKTKLNNIENGANKNIQSDWSQTDTSADDYIKNKPTIPSNITLYSTTGQSTNGTMTQKAITDALNGKASMTTLWENPSPNNSFNSQTITLSSSDWDFLIIVSSMYYGYEAGRYGTITFDGTASLFWCSASTSSYFTWETWARKVTAESKTSLKIADNIYVRNGNSSIQNAHNQPLKIIGVKGA